MRVTISQPPVRGQVKAETTQEIESDAPSRRAMLEEIFACCGNYPEPSMWFSWWRSVNRATPHMFPLSIGAVVQFEGDQTCWLCDSHGWLEITKEQANNWLSKERHYGDMFDINEWKKKMGLTE